MKAKIFFFILLAGVVITNTTVFAASETGVYSLTISSSLSVFRANSDSTSITVNAWTTDHTVSSFIIDLGNGSSHSVACDCSGWGSCACNDSFLYSYSTPSAPGYYTITATMCYVYSFGGVPICSTGEQIEPDVPGEENYSPCCVTEKTQVQVIPDSPCVTDGACNADCPNNCTINEDPDCGCVGGNSCCGLGCDNASDSDCPLIPTPTTDGYDNPLVANDIVEFIQQILIFIFTALMPLCILIIIVGAYAMVSSGGDSLKFDRGRKIVIWALIGFAVSVISRAIINFIWNVMRG